MSLLRQARSGVRVPRFTDQQDGIATGRGPTYADMGIAGGAQAAVGQFISDLGRRFISDAGAERDQGRVDTANREGSQAGGDLASQVSDQLRQAKPGESLSFPAMPSRPGDTPEGAAFNQAVGTAYLTSLDVHADEFAQRLAQEHPTDPQAFKARWDSAGQAMVGQLPQEMRPGASAEWMRKGMHQMAPLAASAQREELAQANATLISAAGQYHTQALNGWRTGGVAGEADQRFRQTIDARTDIDAREKARLIVGYEDEARTQNVLGHFDGAKRQGLGAAESFISRFEDPKTHPDFDPNARDRLSNAMRSDLASLKAEQRMEVAALHEDRRAAEDALLSGRQFPAIDQLRARAKSLGDTDTLSRLDAAQGIARDVSSFAQLPPQDQAADIARRSKTVASEVDNRRLDMFAQVHRNTAAAVRDDPLGYADSVGVRKLTPLDLSSPQGLSASLAGRIKDAEWAKQFYGVPSVPLLRKPETEVMRNVLSSMPATDKAVVLGSMAGTLGPKYLPAVLEQAHAADPEFAHAGAIAAAGDMTTASDILLGGDVRRNFGKADGGVPKMYLPTGPGATDTMRATLTSAMPDEAFRGIDPAVRHGIEETVLSLYAAESYKAGDSNQVGLNDKRIKDAIGRVTGGILEWRGGKMLAPVRGMNQDGLDTLMKGLTQADIGNPVTTAGTSVSVDELRRHGRLVGLGGGRYAVMLGDRALADPATMEDPMLRGKYVLDLGTIAARRKGA